MQRFLAVARAGATLYGITWMFMRTKRPSRSVDYLLSSLSPQDVAHSAAAFVASRKRDAMLDEMRRSIVRMHGGERANLAFTLGHKPPPDDFPLAEPTMAPEKLLAILESEKSIATSRFAAFLERNPRAIRTLDPESIRAILLPVIHGREADVDGTDSADDLPYTYELASALQRALPSLQFGDARRIIRKTAGGICRAVARPFVVAGTAFAAAALWTIRLPGRIVLALARACVALARAVALPFIVVGRTVIAGVRAFARFVSMLPRRLAAALLRMGRFIAAPFIAGARAIGSAATAFARFVSKLPRAVAESFLRAGRFIAAPFIAGARAIGSAATAFARFAVTLPRLVAVAFVRAGRFIAAPFIAAARATGTGVAAFARFAATLPGLVGVALRRTVRFIAVPFIFLGSRIARGARAYGAELAKLPGLATSLGRSSARLLVEWLRASTNGASRILRAGSSASRDTLAAFGAAAGRRSKSLLPLARFAVAPLAVVACGLLGGAVIALLATPVERAINARHQTSIAALAVPPAKSSVPHKKSPAKVPSRHHPAPRPSARPIHTVKPAPLRIARVLHVPSIRHHRARRAWKFDPWRNPYMAFGGIAAIRPRLGPAITRPVQIPATEPRLLQRARLIVNSYLASLQRGDASTALGNLGLSASAPVSNLTEGPVLQRAANFRIVRAQMRDPGTAKVDVVITGAQGRYFGVYTVQANGPAAWITDHTVIPTSTTIASHR
ncbi:MAG TPA: hypothetical protein VGN11_07880 [Candidatus Baltobacteraceae bacterium]|nr:hypothetical protein [Candidatus Baltobacteraceae bacterium]